jgi:predicted nucleic acid-binding protein
MRKRVLLTADVLQPHPYALRNVLLRLGDVGIIVPCWTSAIFAEMRRDILAKRPELHNRQLDRSIRLMRDMFPEADILDYEAELEEIPARVHDRDMLAAAKAARVDAVVTTDRRRFAPELYGYAGVAVLTPDMLLCECLDDDSIALVQLLSEEGVQRGISLIDVLVALYPQAPQFAERVVKLLLPGTSTEQFEIIMRLEKNQRLDSGSEE